MGDRRDRSLRRRGWGYQSIISGSFPGKTPENALIFDFSFWCVSVCLYLIYIIPHFSTFFHTLCVFCCFRLFRFILNNVCKYLIFSILYFSLYFFC